MDTTVQGQSPQTSVQQANQPQGTQPDGQLATDATGQVIQYGPSPYGTMPKTGFTASNPNPIDSSVVSASHDQTQDYSPSDYLSQSQNIVQQTYQDLQQKQAQYDALQQKYSDLASGGGSVAFANNQIQTSGLSSLYDQQTQLEKQAAELKATMNNTLDDVRKQFGGNAPESLIQATAATRNEILKRQLDSITAQQDAINTQVSQKQNIVDKLISANQFDTNKQLSAMEQQTGIAKDDLSTGLQLYRDAVSAFQNDRAAARQATIQVITQSPFAAQALSANPQAMADIQRGVITPAVLGIIGTTYKQEQANLRTQQLQDLEQQRQIADQLSAAKTFGYATVAMPDLGVGQGTPTFHKLKGGSGYLAYSQKEINAVKAVIAANPGEWGHAADTINQITGDPQAATRYDTLLKTAYQIPDAAQKLAASLQGKQLAPDQYNQAREAFAHTYSYNPDVAYKAFDIAMKGGLDKTGPTVWGNVMNWLNNQ